MIVEKVEMTTGQPVDFCQSGIDCLRVKRSTTLEERFLVTEVAHVRAAARDDD